MVLTFVYDSLVLAAIGLVDRRLIVYLLVEDLIVLVFHVIGLYFFGRSQNCVSHLI